MNTSDENGSQFTDLDFQNPLWRKLTEHLNKRLILLRAKNDNERPATDTSYLRGQIFEVKRMLALEGERLDPSE
jgi:hypothetical protein